MPLQLTTPLAFLPLPPPPGHFPLRLPHLRHGRLDRARAGHQRHGPVRPPAGSEGPEMLPLQFGQPGLQPGRLADLAGARALLGLPGQQPVHQVLQLARAPAFGQSFHLALGDFVHHRH